jgi:hypothetical protein
MDWNYAQNKIKANLKVGTDLNTENSTYRKVVAMNEMIESERYGYHNEEGFLVSIGKTVKIKIPWNMLKECFSQLISMDGYSGVSFRKRFPIQANDHPCHVHVVGQIFVASSLAVFDGGIYRILNQD